MMQSEIIALARSIAITRGLDDSLVCAVVEQESGWDTYAIRYEPAFFAKYVAPLYTAGKITGTEAYARGFSWGLMQVMGQVARELGLNSASLALLLDEATGLDYGCKKLKRSLDLEGGNVEKALLRYNGGSNANYPNEVLARQPKYAS